jgi:uncharacterized protein (DUF305 family)
MQKRRPQLSAAVGALVVIAATACASATYGSPSGALRRATVDHTTPAPAGRLSPDTGQHPYTAADVHFMAGMISHHAQAVLMASWAPTHGASGAVRTLCERIVVGQRDEIAFMQRWLGERHEAVPPADPRGHVMPGMDHPMLMPGMLTPEQMAQLDSARGPQFDRLFLKFMIQHHRGAITMVEQLLSTQGAAQDGLVFQFASGVNADQTTEIDRMTRMLDALSQTSPGSPQ